MGLNIVVMAAGRGTRMKSQRAKVLHKLAGRPLLQHVVDTCAALQALRIVTVIGHDADAVEAALAASAPPNLLFVRQEPQLGTGHAVQQALPALHDADDDGVTLILNGDTPLVRAGTMRELVAACAGRRLALLTVELADPADYGRVLRGGDGSVRAIVEQRDASAEQRAIREVYTGMMAAPTSRLGAWLAQLRDDNAQHEFYLTDLVGIASASGVPVVASSAAGETEVLGVNGAAQLAELERRVQRRLADPARLDVRGELRCGSDVEIDVGCVFEGKVSLGDGVRIGAHCVIRDAEIAAGAAIHAFTHMDRARIGAGASVGPYARLRPGAALGDDVHIGNFVEVKNSTLGAGAKANHLAYLGDASVGARANVGAGTITANHDGAAKHRTVIGDDASIGSNCVLVAPVTVGAGATIGAGSTIGDDAPAGELTVARARQVVVPGWKRPVKPRR